MDKAVSRIQSSISDLSDGERSFMSHLDQRKEEVRELQRQLNQVCILYMCVLNHVCILYMSVLNHILICSISFYCYYLTYSVLYML